MVLPPVLTLNIPMYEIDTVIVLFLTYYGF